MGASIVSAAVILSVVYFGSMRLLEAQTSSVVEAELSNLVDDYAVGGNRALLSAISNRTNNIQNPDSIYLLARNDGSAVAGNLSRWPGVTPNGEWQTVDLFRTDIAENVAVGGRAFALEGGGLLFVGRDLREQRNFRRLLANASIALLALFLISGTLGGFLVSRSILSRVNELEEVSAAVESGELSVRASLHNRDDEFDRVAAALNRMLTKNQKLVEQLRMATDSLAHDLRTPLAHLTQKLEALALTLQADKMVASQIAAAIAEAQYIQGVFTELLDISRAEAGLASQQFASVDLANIVNDVVDLYEPVAEEKGISISREIELPVHIAGHKQFLSRAIANLLDNAIKFSPDGERIEVTVTRASGCATFTITDSGVGIPREDWESSLGRFARLNAAREGTGAGLGLSLVQSVANLHGARLVQGDKTDGLEVRLEFPAQEQAS